MFIWQMNDQWPGWFRNCTEGSVSNLYIKLYLERVKIISSLWTYDHYTIKKKTFKSLFISSSLLQSPPLHTLILSGPHAPPELKTSMWIGAQMIVVPPSDFGRSLTSPCHGMGSVCSVPLLCSAVRLPWLICYRKIKWIWKKLYHNLININSHLYGIAHNFQYTWSTVSVKDLVSKEKGIIFLKAQPVRY